MWLVDYFFRGEICPDLDALSLLGWLQVMTMIGFGFIMGYANGAKNEQDRQVTERRRERGWPPV